MEGLIRGKTENSKDMGNPVTGEGEVPANELRDAEFSLRPGGILE
jgi:hypothetical protein